MLTTWPTSTAIPAARSRAKPLPLTSGLGSSIAATTAPTPAQLATGISEALINTAAGLIVAVIAYVARGALRARADRIMVQAEQVREDLPSWLTRPAPAPVPARADAPMPEVALTFGGAQ